MTPDEIADFFAREFGDTRMEIQAASSHRSRLKFTVSDRDLRPGGTVSGPTMMLLADAAIYVAILASVGHVPLAVTTNFSINFLRRPRAGIDLIGECRLIKLGRVLAVGEVSIYSEGSDDPVAHAVATYSLPPKKES